MKQQNHRIGRISNHLKGAIFGLSCAALLSIGLAIPSAVHAESDSLIAPVANEGPDKCVGLTKECYSLRGMQRDECFSTIYNAPSCTNHEVATLLGKRTELSPLLPPGVEAPGLMGPQLVDQECLDNFDNQFSGALLKGGLSSSTIRGLETALEGCLVRPSNDLLQP